MSRWLAALVVVSLSACNSIFGIPDVHTSHDACGDHLASCDPNAACRDTDGAGFACTCDAGYTGDGTTCSDIDECATTMCAAHATCVNSPGAFSCTCDSGYTGDGSGYCAPMTWTKIAAASNFACGVGGDGGMYCWGTNVAGFGDGTTTPHLRPTQIGTATDWTDVAARQDRACGIRSDHSLWCWGSGASGELGDGLMMTEAVPTEVVSDKQGVGWKQVAIGAQTVCAVHTDGSASCWGLDRVAVVNHPLPVAVDANTDWTQIAVGRVRCGLRGSGSLYCWGVAQNGALGLGTTTSQATPAQVGTALWKQLSVGSFGNVCAVRSDGALFCWGANFDGVTALDYGNTPQQIGTATDWSQVAIGYTTILGVRGGIAYAWGNNDSGEAGLAQLGEITNPTPISGTVTGWTQIDVEGESPACGISAGHAYCWGGVGDGALGNGLAVDYDAPTRIGTDTWSAITGGPGLCGVRSDGALLCWGVDPLTGVGFGSTDPVWSPTRLGSDTWSEIAGGYSNSGGAVCGIRNMVPSCWGDNSFGQLGLGNTTTPQLVPAPTVIPNGSVWSGLAIGDHTCGLRNGSSLYCWGNNDTGELGNGSTTSTTAPGAPIAGSWLQVAVTQWDVPASATCAIKADHTLWCWGEPLYPAVTQQLTPTQVGTANTWAQVSMSFTQTTVNSGLTTCAVQTTGTLWCWGMWLGDGTTNPSMTPVQVGTDTDWKSVAVGTEICAVKSVGTLWCFGNADILGDGNPPTFDLATLAVNTTKQPTLIGSDTDWTSVITDGAENSVSCALKHDDSLWCWGAGAAPVTGIITTPSPLE